MSAEESTLVAPVAPTASPQATPQPLPRLEWLIDNADAYRAIVAAVRAARATVWISQLALDADCMAYDVGTVRGRAAVDGTPLVGELLAAARRGVEVRVLLNASLLLDTVKPLRAHLARVGADRARIRVRGVSRFPQLLHAKLVVVDEAEAVLVGSPFANGYWDDARHAPVDARRPARELGGRPVHDLSIRVRGDAARELASVFAGWWNGAQDVAADDAEPLPASAAARRVVPRARGAVRVACTAPGDGPAEILPALLDGIARARSLIYIEHQYLSSRRIVAALAEALVRRPSLETIVVLNQNPDVTAYRGWQNDRLRESGLHEHPRVGLFSLWTSASAPRKRRLLNQVFVHSKVVAIDDRWATAGSANLDGVSLHSYGADFRSRLGQRVFRDVRNFDVNVVLDADADDDAGTGDVGDTDDTVGGPGSSGGDRTAHDQTGGLVRALRTRLWQEHLGGAFHPAGGRPADGWLPLWRSVARRNAAALASRRSAPFLSGPFVLPYSTASRPRDQLRDAGVLFAPEAVELCFEPSWLEVHASVGWVRNMFG